MDTLDEDASEYSVSRLPSGEPYPAAAKPVNEGVAEEADHASAEEVDDGEILLLAEEDEAEAEEAENDEAEHEAPKPLSDTDKDELIYKLEEMRKQRSNQRFELHGWTCSWKSRSGSSGTYDMTCIEDASGAKFHSMLAVKRRLGLIPDPDVPAEGSSAMAAAGGDSVDGGDDGAGGGACDGAGAGPSTSAAAEGSWYSFTEAQVDDLFDAVEAMRKRPKNTDEYVHGWRLIYTLRSAGSAARGDMTAVDPRDGQKIYSMVSLRRKLTGEDEGASLRGLGEVTNKRQLSEYEQPVLLESKRQRKQVNYAEVGVERSARLTDVLLATLDEHPMHKALPAAAWAGLDYFSLAEGVHKRGAGPKGDSVALGPVRGALTTLLRSGRLRRRLAAAELHLSPDGTVAYHLRRLVLNTLQVEADEGAPWALGPWRAPAGVHESDAAAAAQRIVWKGVTPSVLPDASSRGAALVGRVVCVWWEGNGAFFAAKVSAYNAADSAVGDVDGAAGTHVLVYATGLRAVESLEGPGEPQLWRLASAAEAAELEAELEAEGIDTSEEPPPPEALYRASRATANGGGGGGGDADGPPLAAAAGHSCTEDEDDSELPPVRVTLRCRGCLPVGSKGTTAHAMRQASRLRAQAAEEALLSKWIEVYWVRDRSWYARRAHKEPTLAARHASAAR